MGFHWRSWDSLNGKQGSLIKMKDKLCIDILKEMVIDNGKNKVMNTPNQLI